MRAPLAANIFVGILAIGSAAPCQDKPALRFTTETTENPRSCAGPDNTLYVAANDPLEGATVVRLSPTGDVLWRVQPLPGQSTFATALAADDQGNLYVAGATWPTGTPPLPNDAFRSPTGPANTAFVIRFRPDGTMSEPLIFSRPPNNYTSITALATEQGTNRILVSGLIGNVGSSLTAKSFLAWVDSMTWQMELLAQEVGGQATNCSGGSACIGTARVTRISQIRFDTIHHVALVQGSTTTSDFATPGAIQESCYCTNGSSTGWVGAFDLASGARLYTTYLSGRRQYLGGVTQSLGFETISSISWTEANPDQIVITGITASPGFPTTAGAFRSELNCREYVFCRIESPFLATIDWKNNRLVSSTLYGERPAGGASVGLIEDPAGRGYWLASANFLALFNSSGSSLLAEVQLPDELASGFAPAVPVPGGFVMSGVYRISRYAFTDTAGRVDWIAEESKDTEPGPAALGVVAGHAYQLHGNFPAHARAFLWGSEAEAKPMPDGSTDRLRVILPSAIPSAGNMVDLTVADASTGAIHSTVSVSFYPEVFRIATCQNADGATVGGDGNPVIPAGSRITCRLRGVLPGQAVTYTWLGPLKPVENPIQGPSDQTIVTVIAPSSFVVDRLETQLSFRAGGRTTEARRFVISQQ